MSRLNQIAPESATGKAKKELLDIITNSTVLVPPFTLETATRKVRLAEDAWNSRDPNRVALAYTEDSVWRNRSVFLVGRNEIRAFLAGKWERELDYRLVSSSRPWMFV